MILLSVSAYQRRLIFRTRFTGMGLAQAFSSGMAGATFGFISTEVGHLVLDWAFMSAKSCWEGCGIPWDPGSESLRRAVSFMGMSGTLSEVRSWCLRLPRRP